MHTDVIMPARAVPNQSSQHLAHEPTEMVGGLAPIDQVRTQVAAALFGVQPAVTRVHRFQVQKLLGSGGMGVVFAAYDPQLGRTVALKLLQPTSAGERAHERLLREAQAMARLQHPNVVGVYEAGVHDGQVFVVMEYVEGGTLGDWLRVRPRDWQDVVEMLCQAGEGLAAAHAVGLVHRDFKPANILMSAGRARISDFGLARTAADVVDLERTSEDDGLLLASPLTRTGALLGTPAYMAPEQIRGEPATPASDQFAFGVVLYEALCGHRPFAGASVGALLTAIEAGALVKPERKDLPAPLMAIIRRALALEPARRFPGMPALLTALRAVRGARRPSTRMAAVIASSFALFAGFGLLQGSAPAPSEEAVVAPAAATEPARTCAEDPLAGAWSDERRAAVAKALAGTAAGAVVPLLDAYANDLRARLAARCDDPQDTQPWADTCLADRRAALSDLAQAILDAHPSLLAGAPAALELLPALADCTASAKYTTLISEAPPEVRRSAWLRRLGFAEAFLPRVSTREFSIREASVLQWPVSLKEDPRAQLESNFASAMSREGRDAETAAFSLPGSPSLMTPGPALVRQLLRTGRSAMSHGFADLAARILVVALEQLEAREHAQRTRADLLAEIDAALELLPPTHPLLPRLRRDVAYLNLVHARHTTAAGACADGGADFASCCAVSTASRKLAAVARGPDATAVDHELLERALEHAGNQQAAAEARAKAGGLALDERSLGFLDFTDARTVPDPPVLADGIRCDTEADECEVDRKLAASLTADIELVLEDTRLMPSVRDGEVRGVKLYGIGPGAGVRLLGFKNGDLLREVDGKRIDSVDGLRAALTGVFARGGAVAYERKGATRLRKLVLR